MSQPILSIEETESSTKAVANLLPCRIHHDGAIDPIAPYWKPKTEDEKNTAYFRGRKLHGKTVRLPEDYRGVVIEREEKKSGKTQEEDKDNSEDKEEEKVEVGVMKVTAAFDEVVVWGHETVGNAASDPYVRSVEEWLSMANKIHGFEQEGKK